MLISRHHFSTKRREKVIPVKDHACILLLYFSLLSLRPKVLYANYMSINIRIIRLMSEFVDATDNPPVCCWPAVLRILASTSTDLISRFHPQSAKHS